MYSLLAGWYDTYVVSPPLHVLLVGGPGAGKTTLLERIKVTHIRNDSTRQKRARHQHQQQQPPAAAACPVALLFGNDDDDEPQDGIQHSQHHALMVQPIQPSATTAAASTSIQHRRLWICPAPERYARAAAKDDSDHEEDDVVAVERRLLGETNSEQQASHQASSEGPLPRSSPLNGSKKDTKTDFDLARGKSMLPMHKIRPTIGMNLAKNISRQFAGTVVWDVGGRLESLWERYYEHADAVMFVWKLPSDEQQEVKDDDDSDRPPELTPEQQQSLLEQVRSGIPDDVPFLVLGHVWNQDKQVAAEDGSCDHWTNAPRRRSSSSTSKAPRVDALQYTDTCYSTAALLPHYHNPHQALFFANAVTGQGVRSALEWLLPLARQQQRVRRKLAEPSKDGGDDDDINNDDEFSEEW